LQKGLTAHPPTPAVEADKSDNGPACERPGSPGPDGPGTHDTKNSVRAVTWADRELLDTTHSGLGRPRPQRRDGADRVGLDRTGVPIITARKEEPTAEVHLALNPYGGARKRGRDGETRSPLERTRGVHYG